MTILEIISLGVLYLEGIAAKSLVVILGKMNDGQRASYAKALKKWKCNNANISDIRINVRLGYLRG